MMVATRGIQEKMSSGTLTEIKVGGSATVDRVVTQRDVESQLGNVDNTSDLSKPVSTATQAAIDASAQDALDQLGTKRDLDDYVFGDEIDNATFDSVGQLTLNGAGTVWEDENLDPTMMAGKGDLPRIINFATTNLTIAGFQDGRVDAVEGCREYPHKAKLNALGETSVTLNFHFHCYPTDSSGGNAVFELEYVFTEEGIVAPSSIIERITVSIGSVPWTKQSVGFSDIPVPDSLGGQFHFKFSRVGSDVDDTNGSDIAISTIGFHYESDSLGSPLVTSK